MKTRINLIPQEARKKEISFISQVSMQRKLILAIILPLIIFKLPTALLTTKLKSDLLKIQKEIDSHNQQISTLRVSVETDLKTKQEKINSIKSSISEKEKELIDFGDVVKIASIKGKFVYTLMRAIAENISDKTWLDELGFDKEKKDFYLKGFAFSHSEIGTFLAKLSTYPYLKDLYIKNCEINTGTKNKQSLIRFEAVGTLNF